MERTGLRSLGAGRYVVHATVGRGAVAEVYAAWDTAAEQWRAVKVLLPDHAADQALRVRLEREGATMRSLDHPNLVRVVDVGVDHELPFLVMELITGGSLHRWTKIHGVMPPRMAVEVTIQVCSGIAAVHAAGVVHRDVKPRNLLIAGDGVVKITDFGIARIDGSHETQTGEALGTLGFMSPEQLNDTRTVDRRTDVYAIGATLWSLLTARKPRDLFRLAEQPSRMDGIDEAMRPILARCLAHDRDDRFPSVDLLSDALSEHLASLPEDVFPHPLVGPPLTLASLALENNPEEMMSDIRRRDPELPYEAPASRQDETHPDDLMGVAHADAQPVETISVQPAEVRRVVTIQPSTRPRAPGRNLGAWVLPGLVGALLLASLVGGSWSVVAYGAYQIRTAASEVELARIRLSESVGDSMPLPDELAILGADVGPLRAAYERWSTADGEPARSDAAAEVVGLAAQEAHARLGFGERSHYELSVRHRLDRLEASQQQLARVEQDLDAAASSLTGRLAILLRVGGAPAE